MLPAFKALLIFEQNHIMEFSFFRESIENNKLPVGISIYLQSMWHDGSGNWNKAHNIVDSLTDPIACWMHAYLHRKEGDSWNADYWYSKAGKKRPDISLDQEWEIIVKALL